MKVKKQFYCTQEKKTYKVGDEYKGQRKDLKEYVIYPRKRKSKE